MKNLRKPIALLLIFTLLYVSMCQATKARDEAAEKKRKQAQQSSAKAALKAREKSAQAIKKVRSQPVADKKSLSAKFAKHDKINYEQALKLREKIEQKYNSAQKQSRNKQRVKIPKRPHFKAAKGRLLDSTSNQYSDIDQGNYYQAIDSNYVYTAKGYDLYVHKVNGSQLTQIYYQNYSDSNEYLRQIHAANGYFAVIVQKFVVVNSVIIIKIYQNNGANVTFIREYMKLGELVESRQYNGNLLIVTQRYLPSTNPEDIDNRWNISGIGVVSQPIFEGIGANPATNSGPSARSIARIPMGPASNTNYRLAIYLMVDYTWDIIVSPNLNVYVAGNFYDSNGSVCIQKLSFNDKAGKAWGTSQWVILPGLVLNFYQMHQYSGSFRTSLSYSGIHGSMKDDLSIAKIPISNFNLASATIYQSVALNENGFVSVRWRNDLAYLLIYPNIIHTFSSSFGTITNTITPNMLAYYLYPYGNNHMIVFGSSYPSGNDVTVGLVQINNYGLIFKKSATLSANISEYGYSYTYSLYGWFSIPYLQVDYDTRRVTFPIYASEAQPYQSGYFQLYIQPSQNCISGLPVSSNCSAQSSIIPAYGKLFKHFDNSSSYIYATGFSQEILRSSTIKSGGQNVLVTLSYCQLQARILKNPTEAPNIMPYSTNYQVSAVDLCSYPS